MITEFISKLCLVGLCSSIPGMTLANRYVLIKLREPTELDYDEDFVLWGFTFMTIIHELGHFAQRFHLRKELSGSSLSALKKKSEKKGKKESRK
jgi:hypothetical protein